MKLVRFLAAASVTVGTVTALAAGSTPSVTNTGTSSAAVLVFGLPTSQAVFLPNVTFGETAAIQLNAGYRKLTATVTGCQAGDRIILTPTAAVPTGYSIADAYCLTANTLTVNVFAPLLVIGGSYSITAKVTAIR